MARRAVDRALELEPGLPEGHHSLASYYGFGLLDYDQALHEFATVEVSRPNDAEMFYAGVCSACGKASFAKRWETTQKRCNSTRGRWR